MATWLDAIHSANENAARLSSGGVPAPSPVTQAPLKSFTEIMAGLNGTGPIKTAGSGAGGGVAQNTDATTQSIPSKLLNGDWFSSFTNWFNPTRIVTVVLGMILFAAGIFLLGKGPLIETAKETIKDVATGA